ncbi:MAG: type I-D CRISPR-associated protein Cas5/Csc1, partial [Phototrophicales bacterium]
GDERNSALMERSNTNIPTYGRAKEIAVNSCFRFGVISETRLDFPTWIRMGLWMSKAHLKVIELPLNAVEAGTHIVSIYPINPNDLPDDAMLGLFDLVSMRPSSLV